MVQHSAYTRLAQSLSGELRHKHEWAQSTHRKVRAFCIKCISEQIYCMYSVMTFIGRLKTQLYCLHVDAHSEGARFAVSCAWRLMHLRLISTSIINVSVVQLCSKRMGRLVVVTNVSFYERFTRVNSMRSIAMQCWDVYFNWFFDSHRSTRQSALEGCIAKW